MDLRAAPNTYPEPTQGHLSRDDPNPAPCQPVEPPPNAGTQYVGLEPPLDRTQPPTFQGWSNG